MPAEAVKPKPKWTCPPGKRVYAGKLWDARWKDWQCELWLFGTSTGREKLYHFKTLVALLWPEPIFVWDEWCDLFFGALCGDKETVEHIVGHLVELEGKWWREFISSGAASTGKSSKSALWILCNWLCAQADSTCVLTSTSLDQLKRRIWAELCEWIGKSREKLPLEIVASDTEIRWKTGDKRSAIFGIAVKSGGVASEAVDRIKGIHNRRVFVVVDEMTSVPVAITAACRNLNKGTLEYQFIGLGNASERADPHGEHSEPVRGWDSITVDDVVWQTKKGGVCVHLDGHKSPALRDPKRFYFYINKEQMEEDRKFYGGENTPEYWSNVRGFWPPSGLSKTVMDEALLVQFQTAQKAIWESGYEMAGAFDPAFEGGDRRVLYPFKFGKFTSGVIGLELQAPILITVDSEDPRFIHYQIADAVERECKALEILPKNFTMDTSGEGGGLFSVLSGRWSADIISVEFGGKPEKTPVSPERPTTWYELYDNKVSAMWYGFRRYIEGGQVRGLTDPETRTELTSRKYELRGGKTAIEPKAKMKLASHRSPDKADAAVIACEFLRLKGIQPAAFAESKIINADAWNEFAAKQEMDDDNTYMDASYG